MTVSQAIEKMKQYQASGLTLRQAANRFRTQHLNELISVLDTIGSYPSSEPELRALQMVYP